MKGSTGVKVMGVLFIIGAVLGLLSCLVMMFGGALLGAALNNVGAGLALSGIVLFFQIVIAVLELVIGIMAVKNSRVPEKMMTIIILTIVDFALSLINVFTQAGSQFNGAAQKILAVVMIMIFPALMIIFASIVKKQAGK